ncbi:MAG TPA: cupin domain-containing protein, partial [Pyrinomonadaceae bacterium]|nr:cupin domain-containing protein [Pyrinomonadaceae bacterium]
RHRGIEEVFVLQGGYADGRGTYRAGDYVLNEAGSAHNPVALTDPAEDCVMLAVAHGGIEILE